MIELQEFSKWELVTREGRSSSGYYRMEELDIDIPTESCHKILSVGEFRFKGKAWKVVAVSSSIGGSEPFVSLTCRGA